MSHVFISYSKQNRTYARQLADHLLSLGFDVWIDAQIDYGDDWWRTIVRAIRGADAFIVIMTGESDASEWVQREVTLADKSHIPAFPLWLSGDFHASENWAIYVRTQFSDVRSGNLPPDDFFKRLAKSAPGLDVTETRYITNPQSLVSNEVGTDSSPQRDESTSEPVSDSTGNKTSQIRLEVIKALGNIGKESAVESLKSLLTREDQGKAGANEENTQFKVQHLTTATIAVLPPPFDWCFVPGGSVTLETNPPKTYTIEDFLIAKYTITDEQFEIFVDAKDGYKSENKHRWYDFSEQARNYRLQHPKPESATFKRLNLPRTNVSWFDALAFCGWLSNRIGQTVTVPSEQQWQRAATGDTGWAYPWGEEFDESRCCFNDTRPAAVTSYPNGTSPYGVVQMSGNIWEWCLTDYYKPDELDIEFAASRRVLRGGSWDDVIYSHLRATFCGRRDPFSGESSIGFRCVVSAPIP